MLNINKVKHVFLAVGVTDLRKSIDGLSVIVHSKFGLEISEDSVYVFCNRNRDKVRGWNLACQFLRNLKNG